MSYLPPHIPRCQHVRTTGIRCGSPALRGKNHCYYHTAFRQPVRVVRELEDAESIQLALRQVINWIAQGMDTKRVALTLYALQIASSNLKQMKRIILPEDVVTELPEEVESQIAAVPARKKPSASVQPKHNTKRFSKGAVQKESMRNQPAKGNSHDVRRNEKPHTSRPENHIDGSAPPQPDVILSEGGIPRVFSSAGNPSRRTLGLDLKSLSDESPFKRANGGGKPEEFEKMQNG